MNPSHDYLVRALAADNQIRAFCLTDTNLCQKAKDIHATSPLATLALSRLLSAGLLLGDTLKSKDDLLTIQFMGEGPLKHLLATADYQGHVKGYVSVPNASLPSHALDVTQGIGKGYLTVIRDYHLKEPYSSTIPLRRGDISSDLTYYFLQSEQTMTNVGLGTNLDSQGNILSSQGYLIQLMPFTSQKVMETLSRNLSSLPSTEELVRQCETPEELLNRILAGFDVHFTETKEVSFYCGCEKRKERIISTIGKEELKKIIEEGKPIQTSCAFCGKTYNFSVADLEKIYEGMEK